MTNLPHAPHQPAAVSPILPVVTVSTELRWQYLDFEPAVRGLLHSHPRCQKAQQPRPMRHSSRKHSRPSISWSYTHGREPPTQQQKGNHVWSFWILHPAGERIPGPCLLVLYPAAKRSPDRCFPPLVAMTQMKGERHLPQIAIEGQRAYSPSTVLTSHLPHLLTPGSSEKHLHYLQQYQQGCIRHLRGARRTKPQNSTARLEN